MKNSAAPPNNHGQTGRRRPVSAAGAGRASGSARSYERARPYERACPCVEEGGVCGATRAGLETLFSPPSADAISAALCHRSERGSLSALRITCSVFELTRGLRWRTGTKRSGEAIRNVAVGGACPTNA